MSETLTTQGDIKIDRLTFILSYAIIIYKKIKGKPQVFHSEKPVISRVKHGVLLSAVSLPRCNDFSYA